MRSVAISTEDIRKVCEKCGTSAPPIFRHHKGCDGLLGRFSKNILRRYHEWLDCVYLCMDCHCAIHFIYERWFKNWMNYTPGGANKLRGILIGVCDDWLADRLKTPTVPKKYQREFRKSHAIWLKKVEKSATGSPAT